MRVAEYKLHQSRNPPNNKLNRTRGNNAARQLAVVSQPNISRVQTECVKGVKQ